MVKVGNAEEKKKSHRKKLLFHRKAQHLKPLEPVMGSSCIDPITELQRSKKGQNHGLTTRDLSNCIHAMSGRQIQHSNSNQSNNQIEVNESCEQLADWTPKSVGLH